MQPLNFAEYFKRLSNSELLEILQGNSSHQQAAIEAAKNELAARQLSETALSTAHEVVAAKKLNTEKRKQRSRAIDEKLRKAASTLEDINKPAETAARATGKTINGIIAGYTIIILIQVIGGSRWIWFNIKHFYRTPFTNLAQLLPYIVAVPMLVLFIKRKKTGWYLFAFYCIYYSINGLAGLYYFIRESIIIHTPFYTPVLPSPIALIIFTAIYPFTLYMLCKPNILDAFNLEWARVKDALIMASIFITMLVIAVAIF